MYYYGYFRNNDTKVDESGQLFKVVIITNFKKQEFDLGGELMLSDSPFTVNYECEDGNIFKAYKCSTATVSILQKEYNFEFNNTSGCNVLVMLLKYKNELTEEEVKDSQINSSYNRKLQIDNICYDVEWIGYATPNTYSQDFENLFDEFELECQDALSTLKYTSYKIQNEKTTFASFIDIIKRYSAKTRAYKNIYVADTLVLPVNADADIFNFCYIDERNFFDEDETAKKVLEVIEQLCLYLNVTLIPYNDSLYIVDYNGLKNNYCEFYHYKYTDEKNYTITDETDNFILQKNKVTFEHQTDIKADDFSGTGTKLTLESTFNKMSVKDSLYSFDTISVDFDNIDRWVYSEDCDVPGQYDDYNVISESDGVFITDGRTDTLFNNYVEWGTDANGLTVVKKRPDEDKNLTVICNSRKGKQKCYIKYLQFIDSSNIFNDSRLKTTFYFNDTKVEGKISCGNPVYGSFEGEPKFTYKTSREYCGAQLIAYHTEKVDSFQEHPMKIELKPAILCHTPTSISQKDIIDKNYFDWGSNQHYCYNPYFSIKSKSVALGSGDYIVISGTFKFYKNDDMLPIDVDATDDIYSEYMSQCLYYVKFGNKYFPGLQANRNKDYSTWGCWGDLGADGRPMKADITFPIKQKAFGVPLKIGGGWNGGLNFKDKLGVDGGIVIPAPQSDLENGVEVGDIEVFFFKPISPSLRGVSKYCIIEDLKIEIITKSDLNSISSSSDDTDTEYTNIIDEDAIEEKDNIELDVTTWDNKQPNYSSVIYSDAINIKDNNVDENRLFKRVKHIFNRCTGELLRAEEHIIYNNIIQYSTPTISLNLNLHVQPKPYSTYTYHFFKDKLFVVDSCELDYINNSYNIKIIEKK